MVITWLGWISNNGYACPETIKRLHQPDAHTIALLLLKWLLMLGKAHVIPYLLPRVLRQLPKDVTPTTTAMVTIAQHVIICR